MGFRNPILGGGGALVRPAIKSPNYQSGVAGWTINRAGDAEFNDLTVRGVFQGLDFVQSAEGIFFYNGTPAAGNLAGSWAAAAGVDPYGNTYMAGIAVYDPSTDLFAQMTSGELRLGLPGGAGTEPALLTATDFGLQIQGTTTGGPGGNPDALRMQMQNGEDSQPIGSTYNPHLTVTDSDGQSPADLTLSGALIRTDKAGTYLTWQTPVYRTGWAGGSSAATRYQALQYRIDGQDNLVLVGAMHATAALAAGSYTLFTVTGDYVPKKLFGGMALQVSSADAYKDPFRLNVDNNGQVGINTPVAIAAGDTFYINEIVPLGNLQ